MFTTKSQKQIKLISANFCITAFSLVIKACGVRMGIVLAHSSRDNSEL